MVFVTLLLNLVKTDVHSDVVKVKKCELKSFYDMERKRLIYNGIIYDKCT